jgi:hypothetical protein
LDPKNKGEQKETEQSKRGYRTPLLMDGNENSGVSYPDDGLMILVGSLRGRQVEPIQWLGVDGGRVRQKVAPGMLAAIMMAGPPFSGGGDRTADFRVIRPSSWWTYEKTSVGTGLSG